MYVSLIVGLLPADVDFQTGVWGIRQELCGKEVSINKHSTVIVIKDWTLDVYTIYTRADVTYSCSQVAT